MSGPGTNPGLSVIVPVGPGEDAWPGLLEKLETLDQSTELILSAADPPPDDLPAATGDCPLDWRTGSAGRARQLNAGIAAARGRWLWLLHADCRPSAEAVALALRTAQTDQAGLFHFALEFLGDGPALTRLNAFGANLRSRLFALPFGDQGFLLPARLAAALGGFDEDVAPGEDLDFVVRARAAGWSVRRLPATVAASAREYRQRGWLATTLRHACLTLKVHRQSRARIRARIRTRSHNRRNDPSE